MTFEQWLEIGRSNKWISEPYCDFHGDWVMTSEEQKMTDEGDDFCVHVLRLFSEPEHFDDAEQRQRKAKVTHNDPE